MIASERFAGGDPSVARRLIRGLVALVLCLLILAPSAAWGRMAPWMERKKDPKGDETLATSKQNHRIVYYLYIPFGQSVILTRSAPRLTENNPPNRVTEASRRHVEPRNHK